MAAVPHERALPTPLAQAEGQGDARTGTQSEI